MSHRPSPPASRLPARWPLLLTIWGLATAGGLFVAATTKVGRVVVEVTPAHGVHLGDVLAFGSLYALAGMLTVRACRA